MSINTNNVRRLLAEFDFRTLFAEELGWDRAPGEPVQLSVDGRSFRFQPAAQKRDMVALVWQGAGDEPLPDRSTRLKIYREVSKIHFEHFLIFTDTAHTLQEWTWVRKEPGKPLAPRVAHWRRGQSNEALMQKLAAITVSIEEEEQLRLSDVTGRVRSAWDVEKVTKKFYDRFQKEHKAFLGFVEGIRAQGDREWYASVMLNRLMFVYFIQKKGFLDGDRDYLHNRLEIVRDRKGNDRFHSFYRSFLLHLFHRGLGSPEHSPETRAILGKVPYLNGGLFDVHQLEAKYGEEIQIPDEAFERIFDFFDDYQWHLDERPLRDDQEINPDVLGYIFEKYINQKQMGAYYTKEDITEYIGKNTILPSLFDAARARCEVAFRPEGALWGLLRDNPDRYIYPAVRKGVIDAEGKVIPLPAKIEAGVNDVAARGGWNRPADADFALPTETWREHVARRTRCLELREGLRRGEVHEISDLITYNLDIRQFAEDVIFNSEGPELLRAFWISLAGRIPLQSNEKPEHGVTVLDPTCGSGAFLFAALNILQPLYDACLERMQGWVDELENAAQPPHPEKFRDFRDVLGRVNDRRQHPNRDYYILKSIILNNLFGVDIMAEAVEICKLRLFLKLVAQVERVEDVEPLPDIDFNIRTGNTLVGFATPDEVRRAVEGEKQAELMLGDKSAVLRRIKEDAETVDRAFRQFQQMQTREGMDGTEFHEAKGDLRERLTKLDEELNRYLAKEYGIDPDKPKEYKQWKESHQPFHWFVDFYGIVSRGGFDAIIGNPPYIELSKLRGSYTVREYSTASTGNLYAPIGERALELLNASGNFGMIVPMSIACTDRMEEMRTVLQNRAGTVWMSHYSGDANPSKLFEGAKLRLSIVLADRNATPSTLSSPYLKWFADEREVLFESITYSRVGRKIQHRGLIPKTGSVMANAALSKVLNQGALRLQMGGHAEPIYLHRVLTMYVKCFDFVPHFWNEADGLKKSDDYKPYRFAGRSHLRAALAILNSSTFFYYFIALGDCFHCGKEFVETFPVSLGRMAGAQQRKLARLAELLMEDMRLNAVRRIAQSQKTGRVEYDEFWPRYSKPIIDEIDRVLAQHYGFTPEELDFIINYDIKYRMGREALEAGEAEEDAA